MEYLSLFSKEMEAFVKSALSNGIALGRHELSNGCYANVESYVTYPRNERCFESHEKFIDIQLVLEGEEYIEWIPVSELKLAEQYDETKDVAFWHTDTPGELKKLSAGEFCVIYPGMAHMPCLQVSGKSDVKKVVVKIPISNVSKIFFTDIDGTLTDGKIHISSQGELFKSFDVKDGYAIGQMLPKMGFVPAVITGRKSEIVMKRCEELNIAEIHQGISDKLQKMLEIAAKYGCFVDISGMLWGTAYAGDDLPDEACMKLAQYAGCPADAVDGIRAISNFVAERCAGNGAVREFVEWLRKEI